MKTTTYSLDVFSFIFTNLIVNATILTIAVLWLYMKWNHRHIERLASQLKGPKSYPIIGMTYKFFGTQQDIMENILEMIKDYGLEPIKLWLGQYLAVVIIKPEDVQIVLNNSLALQKDWTYDFIKFVAGNGLLTAPVDKWREHRRLINPAFNTNQLKQFLPIINKITQILSKKLQIEMEKTQSFDLMNYISCTTFDVIYHTSMGYNHGTESNSDYKLFTNDFTKGLELVGMRLFKPWYYPDIVFSIYLRLTGKHTIFEKVRKLPNQIIKEKKEIYRKRKLANLVSVDNSEENGFKTFIDILLESNDINDNFSDDEMRDEIMTMMIAGSESTAIADCYCLLLLAIHPDIQDKVYNEINEIFSDGNRTITFEDTIKLVYLDQVIKETIRLLTIVPVLIRKLQGDVKISNYTLPKGIRCVISPAATHHMPELYPNPWTFNPENFNPENVAKRHRYSFIPFSGGPRGCIGEKFAMLSMKVLIATILRNFSVHTEIKLSDIKFKVDLLMRSVHGYPVTIRPRNRMPKI